MAAYPPPNMFGLPDKFTEWRSNQAEAVDRIVDCPTRFLSQVCPTGFGKSLTYVAAAIMSGQRTIILTSTKGLQTQLMRDFGHMPGVYDIRGRANYPCRLNTKATCDVGLCVFGVRCQFADQGGCHYFDQLNRVKSPEARVVVTNYSYWMAQNEFSDGLGAPFARIVCDEAHAVPDHVVDHVAVTLSKVSRLESEVLRLEESLPVTFQDWVAWADDKRQTVEALVLEAKLTRKEKRYLALKRLQEKLNQIVRRMDPTWIWEEGDAHVTLSPVWADRYAEEVLFLGVPNILLTSATVVPKTANMLGVPDEDHTFEEYPHTFPKANRRLYHIPTVRLNFRNGPLEERQWLTRLDQIIRDRADRKGIVHTVSYARRNLVLENSKFSSQMITHNRADTESVVRRFKRNQSPLILVSPSMATGWDFPDDECRWQVIIKLPYPDTRGNVMKTRSKLDPDYTSYLTMQQLIQACGRGVRSATDWCETFIIDDNIVWFIDRYQHLAVNWFMGAFGTSATVPKART